MSGRGLFMAMFFLCMAEYVVAQSSEAGITAGISSYKGDIVHSLFDPEGFRPAGGIFYRRSISNHWSYRLGVYYGTITGDDQNSSDPFQRYRNLSFRSRLLEGYWIWEFNFFPYQTANPASMWTPYIFTGMAFFHFNPKALWNDQWIALQPLGTEGQGLPGYNREKYRRIQPSLPFGGGIKFRLSNRFGMAIEAGARRTFTDYLDDVSTTYPKKDLLLAVNGPLAVVLSDRSPERMTNRNDDRQRGDAAHKDWYLFAGIQLNFTLSKKYNDSCQPFRRKFR
jgi:hypothetical protein